MKRRWDQRSVLTKAAQERHRNRHEAHGGAQKGSWMQQGGAPGQGPAGPRPCWLLTSQPGQRCRHQDKR